MIYVYVLAPNEQWIVDRFVQEFNRDNRDVVVNNPHDADVIWLFADWCWEHIPYELLQKKKVITTIHHIVPSKFNARERAEFTRRDAITTCYHVPNVHTKIQVEQWTDKDIHVIPYWANGSIFQKTITFTVNDVEPIKPTKQRLQYL